MSSWVITDSILIPLTEIKRIVREKKELSQQEIPTFDFITSKPIPTSTSTPKGTTPPVYFNYILTTMDNKEITLTKDDYESIRKEIIYKGKVINK
jgi:hypothetical protein